MKVKVLSRSDASWNGTTDGAGAVRRTGRNPAPHLHPPLRPLEAVRALNAAKVGRMLARPFLFSLEPGHVDGVYGLARSRTTTSLVASASADGELKLWHLPSQRSIAVRTPLPRAFIRDVAFSCDSSRVLAVSDAKLVYAMRVAADGDTLQARAGPVEGVGGVHGGEETPAGASAAVGGEMSYLASAPLSAIDAHYKRPVFATASDAVEVWDETRSEPIQRLTWGVDSLHTVSWNPVEQDLLASAASDRSVTLYDIRERTPLRKLVMALRANTVAWNPMEAFNFTIGCDDGNCYSFDIRLLGGFSGDKAARPVTAGTRRSRDVKEPAVRARTVHKDHVGAVMSVSYSPTGREFASGSYDRTVRLWDAQASRSKEVYHTRRMQKVFSVLYSGDGRYVLSGSDDSDVRVWKADAARPIKPLLPPEQAALNSASALVERYSALPDVRRIAKKRHVPKPVKAAQLMRAEIAANEERKHRNVVANSGKGKAPKRKSVKERSIVTTLE